MTAVKLDGKRLAGEIRRGIARRIERASAGSGKPGLLLIRVGEDPASVVYVRGKQRASQEVGIDSRVEVLPETTSEGELLARVERANRDPEIHGLLVQLPLPRAIRPEAVAEAIDPEKDVDGLHPFNQGRLALGRPGLVPCTPLGILALLARYEIPLAGARVAVLGRSAIVGRSTALLFGQKAEWADASVALCHSRTRDLAAYTREADVVVAAMGRPRAVVGAQIRPGAAVVDVGIHRLDDPDRPGKSRLVGDVDAESVEPVAGYLSPVPGGVGPLTVAMLLANTLCCFERRGGDARDPIRSALALALEGGEEPSRG
jgi:methylenetetrahydrofolate dehydrogenase (NADP+)/methenyltetrahydrofolate cyclohydrolase